MDFSNPVFPSNFADPFILRSGSDYYAYSTNSGETNLPVLRSDDLVHWKPSGDAMPRLGGWAVTGTTWAPEVVSIGDSYMVYYTARGASEGVQCVGRAVSESPTGPFIDDSAHPLLCDSDGGSIDASPFRDVDGTLYLYWKNDGNAVGRDTFIYGAALSADGLRLVGDVVPLFRQDAAWEGHVVEGPVMWLHDDRYYLFYSGNAFDRADYAVGYATSEGPLGPCVKAAENPILASAGRAAGPGHCNLIDVNDVTWMVYHAWDSDAVGEPPGRTMWLDRVDWVAGRPVVRGPGSGSQPAP